ncbi:CBS domain-containing protein (plasmid) [Pseudorhodobacter turbinis]|uniref:CBS domain-containing protein n=1 Tax=Pseudorhodobacter turbinis TaxID=2500533 RepID=A0A4P8ELB4_9RHOB|nr:CBS domain-containing protein [Pseudorhodobacter turbinis]QCO57595.1 CBS domain-containing protein [Pseudorhodobacter turbinis]
MLVRDIMQKRVSFVGPNASVHAAAALMQDRDIGILPVCEDGKPIGVVTDRDLAMRLLADVGVCAEMPVRAVMTPQVYFCHADQDITVAAHMMGDWQIRRLLVCDVNGALMGIVSLGDMARDASEELAGQTLGEIVETR